MNRVRTILPVILAGLILILASSWPNDQVAGQTTPQRRVNVPYTTSENGGWPKDRAIFWFGQVNPTSNYADVRTVYNDTQLIIHLNIFDRLLWFDSSPSAADLEQWDAVTLYLDLSGNTGSTPQSDSYRFVVQLRQEANAATYQGNGTGWETANIAFTPTTGWRGDGVNNGAEARGWSATFKIPYSSLGLAGKPAEGTVWGLGLALHDRDDAAGTPIADQVWPEILAGQQPSTWGQLHFGLATYTPPPASPAGSTTIRHGLNGAVVEDGQVGGGAVCGDPFNPNFFNGWGDANYAGDEQVNVQNQMDVADWPCFSKFYLTLPLDAVPAGKEIISATLTVYQFGNAGAPGEAEPSVIRALTVAESWSERSITWNNAPLAIENVAQADVDPITNFPGWPGVPITWDVSGAVAEAYAAGEPLRLALYSADSERHSGKYFTSSDTGDWNADGRPTLAVVWGESALQITPPVQQIQPGQSAEYMISADGLSGTVTLSAPSPSPDLLVSLAPSVITPPQTAVLTLTDTHSNVTSGIWYTVPVTGTNGSETQSAQAQLLVGGTTVFLPIIER